MIDCEAAGFHFSWYSTRSAKPLPLLMVIEGGSICLSCTLTVANHSGCFQLPNIDVFPMVLNLVWCVSLFGGRRRPADFTCLIGRWQSYLNEMARLWDSAAAGCLIWTKWPDCGVLLSVPGFYVYRPTVIVRRYPTGILIWAKCPDCGILPTGMLIWAKCPDWWILPPLAVLSERNSPIV